MNFVYIQTRNHKNHSALLNQHSIYMHSYPYGEKIDNIKRNSKVGFEVDQHQQVNERHGCRNKRVGFERPAIADANHSACTAR